VQPDADPDISLSDRSERNMVQYFVCDACQFCWFKWRQAESMETSAKRRRHFALFLWIPYPIQGINFVRNPHSREIYGAVSHTLAGEDQIQFTKAT
jgi:hypothetical protein